jgi:hypothetical protein
MQSKIVLAFTAAAAFATLVASPALAQSYDPHVGSGNIVPRADAANYLRGPVQRDNYRAFARVPGYRAFARVPGYRAFARVRGYRGQVYHWPRYDARGVDQNAPE